MIRYTLRCGDGHEFESWFQSSAAFDSLKSAGHLACAVCGTSDVDRTLMTPGVPAKSNKAAPAPLAPPQNQMEQALAALRKHVESTSDYVGLSFAKEARAMHDGDTPERPIYGEAKLEDAKKLIEDGIPVAPLPFLPKRKTN